MTAIMEQYNFDKHGTCDQCAQGDVDLCSASEEYPDAWICRDCVAQYERAIAAAVKAYLRISILRPMPEQVVRKVIDAFFEVSADPDQNGSSGEPS